MSDLYVCICTHDYRGLGACSPGKFLEIGCSEIASGHFGIEAEQ